MQHVWDIGTITALTIQLRDPLQTSYLVLVLSLVYCKHKLLYYPRNSLEATIHHSNVQLKRLLHHYLLQAATFSITLLALGYKLPNTTCLFNISKFSLPSWNATSASVLFFWSVYSYRYYYRFFYYSFHEFVWYHVLDMFGHQVNMFWFCVGALKMYI